MSETSGGGTPIERVKTLASSGLYLDRRVFGPEITKLTDELAEVGAPHENVGVNVPDKLAVPEGPCDFKMLAVELVENKEVDRNRELLGEVSKFAAMATLVKAVPTIIKPMSEVVEDKKVVFSHLLIDTDDYTGDTFFSLFPDERTFAQLRLEQVRSWLALAALAKIDISRIAIKKPHFDLRLAYVRGDVSYRVVQRMTDVLRKRQTVNGDMMPGIDLSYFSEQEPQPR